MSGNVFHGGKLISSRLSDDSHRFLADANLYDGIELDSAWLQAVNRGTTSTGGGFTSTQHVFWNLSVIENHGSAQGCALETAQLGWGYAVGSRAASGSSAKLCPDSFSNGYWATLDLGTPDDFIEAKFRAPRSTRNRCTRTRSPCAARAKASPALALPPTPERAGPASPLWKAAVAAFAQMASCVLVSALVAATSGE